MSKNIVVWCSLVWGICEFFFKVGIKSTRTALFVVFLIIFTADLQQFWLVGAYTRKYCNKKSIITFLWDYLYDTIIRCLIFISSVGYWYTLYKKWSFPVRISSVSLTKSAKSCLQIKEQRKYENKIIFRCTETYRMSSRPFQ